VAEWAGTSVQDIQDLNPELRRWTTPIRAAEYELKVPMGAAAAIHERIEQGVDDLTPVSHYTVRKGETLLSIAKKLRVSRSDLADANYLSTKSTLQTGQRLIIPRAPALLAARGETGTTEASDVVLASPGDEALPRTAPLAAATPVDEIPTQSKTMHRVTRGDTLSSIARQYGTSVALIKELNSLRGNLIQVGQRLRVERRAALSTN
jgi:membrane-bound lytic murein transglycosylase D